MDKFTRRLSQRAMLAIAFCSILFLLTLEIKTNVLLSKWYEYFLSLGIPSSGVFSLFLLFYLLDNLQENDLGLGLIIVLYIIFVVLPLMLIVLIKNIVLSVLGKPYKKFLLAQACSIPLCFFEVILITLIFK